MFGHVTRTKSKIVKLCFSSDIREKIVFFHFLQKEKEKIKKRKRVVCVLEFLKWKKITSTWGTDKKRKLIFFLFFCVDDDAPFVLFVCLHEGLPSKKRFSFEPFCSHRGRWATFFVPKRFTEKQKKNVQKVLFNYKNTFVKKTVFAFLLITFVKTKRIKLKNLTILLFFQLWFILPFERSVAILHCTNFFWKN